MRSAYDLRSLPIAVLGAGPVGLTTAAHLADRGIDFIVLDRGTGPGAHVREWGHIRMFSPWRYNIDPVVERMLRAAGWAPPDPEAFPTGEELYRYLLAPLAALPSIAPHLRYTREVVSVSRAGLDRMKSSGRRSAPFLLRVRRREGGQEDLLARAVIDATGTSGTPKPLGAHGLPALGEPEAAARISDGPPDLRRAEARRRYAGRRVAVVGGGDSAYNALADLAAFAEEHPGTEIHWVLRSRPSPGGGAADQLPRRAALGGAVDRLLAEGRVRLRDSFPISALELGEGGLRLLSPGRDALEVDEVIRVTGFRPDLDILRELRLQLDPITEAPEALGPLIDPNVHSCGTVPPHGHRELRQPEDGLFVVGMKSYGRAPTFLLRTGYEQVRSVVAALAGDLRAADEVSLTLPETGVCGLPPHDSGQAAAPSPADGESPMAALG
jgi:FAD dependent oxidoreductase